MSLSAPPRPGWIDYVWLFRLLLELPAPTGGRGGGTCLPNLPKYLQQQSCPGQPSAVPSREDKLSVLWQHIFQHFQLEQACEEASHRLITSRLLTHVEKIYMLHCASLFFLYKCNKRYWLFLSALLLTSLWPRLLVFGFSPRWKRSTSMWGVL